MSHHRSNDYEDRKDYLDYGYSDNQEESYESESNEEEDNGNGVLENKGNISPLFARVTVLVTLVTVLIAENSRMIRKLLRRILDY